MLEWHFELIKTWMATTSAKLNSLSNTLKASSRGNTVDEQVIISPKLAEARHAALGLLKAAGVTAAPTVLNDIYHHACKVFDLVIAPGTEKEVGSKLDAVTKRIGDEIFIVYNKERHPNRIRFSIAHELGHLYMGHVHGSSSLDFGSENFDEKEANQFAAQLLMPTKLLRADIKAGIKNVADLIERYKVSEEAMWWQIDKAGLLNLL